MSAKFLLPTTTLLLLLSTSPAWAGGAVEIGGNFTSDVKTKDVTVIGIGQRVTTDTNLGGIQGSASIKGNFTSKVVTGNVTNIGIGQDISSRLNIAGIQSRF